jgi:methionine-rich copper-binding protein CopC
MIKRTKLLALLVLCSPALAHAHAMLDRADPPVGGTIGSAPRAVSLTFSEKLEPAFSTVRVENAGGARVDQGKPQVERGSGNVLRVGLKSLPPGSYKVIWKVLSVDTHTTEGSFSFQVGR